MPTATPPGPSTPPVFERPRRPRASGAPAPAPRVEAWGRLAHDEALRRQLEIWKRRVSGNGEDVIAVVEHPSVITLGRHAPLDDLLVDRVELEHAGIALVRTDRGGRATYHGPGQAVVYPIVSLQERGLGVKQWVGMLEAALSETLRSFGVDGHALDGRPGIWVGDAKIASIGLRVACGVSYHGVSINVESRTSEGFAHIVACGVPGQRVTSLEDQVQLRTCGAGRHEPVTVEEAAATFCRLLIRRLRAHEKA